MGPAERRTYKIKEAELLALTKDWLKIKGLFWFRIHQSFGSTPGLPDLVALHKASGRVCFIELKASRGRPSFHQIAFAQEAGKAGAIAIISSDFDYIVGLLSDEGTRPGYYSFMPEEISSRRRPNKK